MSAGPPPGLGGEGHEGGIGNSSGGGRRQASTHRSTSSTSGAPPGLSGSNTGTQSPSGSTSGSSVSSLITIVKAQISFLLSTLTDDNFAKNKADIAQVSGECSFSLIIIFHVKDHLLTHVAFSHLHLALPYSPFNTLLLVDDLRVHSPAFSLLFFTHPEFSIHPTQFDVTYSCIPQ